MSRRYHDAVQAVQPEAGPPQSFRWHRRRYQVRAVLAHWVQAAPWWPGSSGTGSSDTGSNSQVVQAWRVEAAPRTGAAGVYDLMLVAGAWHLQRVID